MPDTAPGESIEKLKPGQGQYRQMYDRRKAVCTLLHPDWTPMHLRADARRIAVKELVKQMWIAWRASVPA